MACPITPANYRRDQRKKHSCRFLSEEQKRFPLSPVFPRFFLCGFSLFFFLLRVFPFSFCRCRRGRKIIYPLILRGTRSETILYPLVSRSGSQNHSYPHPPILTVRTTVFRRFFLVAFSSVFRLFSRRFFLTVPDYGSDGAHGHVGTMARFFLYFFFAGVTRRTRRGHPGGASANARGPRNGISWGCEERQPVPEMASAAGMTAFLEMHPF